MNIIKEIFGDLGNRDIIYIELVPLNEEQKKVERALELR
jgi:hypothetical protein